MAPPKAPIERYFECIPIGQLFGVQLVIDHIFFTFFLIETFLSSNSSKHPMFKRLVLPSPSKCWTITQSSLGYHHIPNPTVESVMDPSPL